MLSLITQRLARLPTTSFSLVRASALLPSTLPIQPQTRRTFLTGSPYLAFPTTAKSTAAASAKKKSTATASGTKGKPAAKKPATKKPAAKTATKAKAKPTRKVAAKKKPVPKKKPKKPVKPTHLKLKRTDFPPRSPGSAYVFFYTNYIKTLPAESKPKSTADIIQCSKTAGHLWGSMTDAEKEPFKEQERAAKATYQVQREAYWKGVDSKTLAEINRRRRVKGKFAIRRVKAPEDKRPLGSFLRYMADFRNSPDAQTIKASTTPGPPTLRVLAQTAGMRWRAMSEAEKAKYTEPAAKDREAWSIKHPKTQA